MKTLENLKVGDTAWFIRQSFSQSPSVTTVLKIGTKLITTDDGVFRKDTLKTDDGYRRLVLDLDHYNYVLNKGELVRTLRHEMEYYNPDKIALETLLEVAKLLGIEWEPRWPVN